MQMVRVLSMPKLLSNLTLRVYSLQVVLTLVVEGDELTLAWTLVDYRCLGSSGSLIAKDCKVEEDGRCR